MTNSKKAKDYRPISLCNVCYKTITKILVKRLKLILAKIISPEQRSFIKGSIISDDVLAAQEIKGDVMVIKLDMKRVYDLMGWAFIEGVMIKFRFEANFVKLILVCITTLDFAVLVNGSPTKWFKCTMGLRQDDPLLHTCLF